MFSTSSLGATATDRDLPDLGRREGGAEEEKSAGYPERSLSLLRDMESIRDQAEAKETAAAANYEGGGGGRMKTIGMGTLERTSNKKDKKGNELAEA